jgi:hypothetical protein
LVVAASARNTSLGKDLQYNAEAVKDTYFPKTFTLSLGLELRLILSLKLSFTFTFSIASEGHCG